MLLTVLRWVLLMVIGVTLLGLVVAVGTTGTGVVEKAALVGAALVLVFAASRAHRIGRGRTSATPSAPA